jgi:Rod binding domain-containing protein
MDISGTAMSALQSQPVAAPRLGAGASTTAIDKAAKEFESVFISQFLGAMFSGIKSDDNTGGGEGEEMFRSLMVDQYASGIEKQGGLGLAASVKSQMLKMQEM